MDEPPAAADARAAAGPLAAAVPAGQPRRAYLDNLKVVLVACVILGHAFITYSELGSWAYREPSANDVFNLVAAVFVALGSLFAMGLFFLVAGLLTPGPVRRKGPAGFLRDRALRLGAPFLAYVLLVFPLVTWAGERDHPLTYYLRDQLADPDPGPLWFVGVLLVFSTVYVLVRTIRPAPAPSAPAAAAGTAPPGLARFLVALALAIAVASFVVRLQFPVDSAQILSAHVWQWPQCIGLFVLGLLAAERGWLQPVSPGLRRAGGLAAGSGALVMMAAIATAPSPGPFAGGPTWQSALTSACEGAIAVGLSVWLMGVFQRRFDHAGPLTSALGRAAFGAYVLQAPVLVTLALLASRLPLAPEVRFLIVAPAGVAGSFALSWLLTRVPGVRRVL